MRRERANLDDFRFECQDLPRIVQEENIFMLSSVAMISAEVWKSNDAVVTGQEMIMFVVVYT